MHHRLHRLPIVLLLVVLCASTLVPAPVALAQEGTDDPGEITIQADVTTVPKESKKSGGIAYFLYDTQKKIKRFNMQTGAWLPDITFSLTPTTMAVDADGLYVAFGAKLIRYPLNGGAGVTLYTASISVFSPFTCGSYLYFYDDNLKSINKITGQLIDSKHYNYGMAGSVTACSKGRFFGVDDYDLYYIILNNDGTLGPQAGTSFYYGEHWIGWKIYLSSAENRIITQYGEVFTAADLAYTGELTNIDDMDFRIDQPVGLYSGEIIGYTNTLVETGRYTPTNPPFKLFTNGASIYAFSVSSAGLAVEQIAASKLHLPTAGQTASPSGLRYTVDDAVIDKDGTVYLLNRSNFSIFRWSIPGQKYLSTIPIQDAALQMAYDEPNHRLYLAYPTSKITKIDLASSLTEQTFATPPGIPCAITPVGEYVFLCTNVVGDKRHITYNSDGTVLSQMSASLSSPEFAWNSVTSKVYFVDDWNLDLWWEAIDENGMIGTLQKFSYFDEETVTRPIRITPDGAFVLLGTGVSYDAATLTRWSMLPHAVADAAWVDGTLFTIYLNGSETALQKWNDNNTLALEAAIPGDPGYLFGTGDGLFAITYVDGMPRFSAWTTDLEKVYPIPSYAFLPVCQVQSCDNFFDTFDINKGWVTGENDNVLVQLINGEYRIEVKPSDTIFISSSPNCPLEDYTVEVEAYWMSSSAGGIYSLAFGIDNAMEQFYLLDIDTDYQKFAVWYYDGSNFSSIIAPQYTSVIPQNDTDKNTLHLEIQDRHLTVIINGVQVASADLYNLPEASRVGVSVTSGTAGFIDARFDNFSVVGSGAVYLSQPLSTSPAGETGGATRPPAEFFGIDQIGPQER